mmetsp:Transcript_11330/g.19366  ORF Transcript_11330/g.19366 Transcript_11330/m.19366 type:complete len:268 (-) Transcript_11330:39-842(-)
MDPVDQQHGHIHSHSIAQSRHLNQVLNLRFAELRVEVVELRGIRPCTTVRVLAMCTSICHELGRIMGYILVLGLLDEKVLLGWIVCPYAIDSHMIRHKIQHELHATVEALLSKFHHGFIPTQFLRNYILHNGVWTSNHVIHTKRLVLLLTFPKMVQRVMVCLDPRRLFLIQFETDVAQLPYSLKPQHVDLHIPKKFQLCVGNIRNGLDLVLAVLLTKLIEPCTGGYFIKCEAGPHARGSFLIHGFDDTGCWVLKLVAENQGTNKLKR